MLQVSSVLGFHAAPTFAAYSGSKAYVLSFSEALNHELRGTGVTSTALCPGVTATEFLYVAGQQPTLAMRLMMMRSADVARTGVRGMLRRRKTVVPGLLNKLTAQSYRLLPRRTATRVLSWAMST
jgi:short-subunit dehydrogenase